MGSIAETLLMGIGKQRTSMEARLAGRAAAKGPELEIVQVAALELETSEVEIVPEAAELGIGPVVEPETLELVIALAAALEREIVQVAVLLRTKSVTAALRCGLLAVLAVAAGDLAAAAVETTRGPAAAEAATAWAAEE
jgi:hypothetical protein